MGDDRKSNFAKSSGPNPALNQSTPNLFSAAQQHMPASYFGNQPINDPTSILNAYMQHLPDFLASTRSQNSVVPKPVGGATPASAAANPITLDTIRHNQFSGANHGVGTPQEALGGLILQYMDARNRAKNQQ